MAHKHAKLMMEYAKDAAKHDRPWELWEYLNLDEHNSFWHKLFEHPDWGPHHKYRRKPRAININGIEVPEPVREALEDGANYFVPSLSSGGFFYITTWIDSFSDNLRLERGLVHLTEDAAIQHAKAMLSFTTEEK